MQIGRFTAALAAIAALSACDQNRDQSGGADGQTPQSAPSAAQTPAAKPSEAVSILRADIEQPDLPVAPLEPLSAVVGFPAGGTDLDAAALLELQKIIISPQLEADGTIILGGHSDSGGTDAANERASMGRAQRVQQWLISNGIAPERIRMIAFGEQNPASPNALPDGSPNEEGRALNRRVEVLVTPADQDTGPQNGAATPSP